MVNDIIATMKETKKSKLVSLLLILIVFICLLIYVGVKDEVPQVQEEVMEILLLEE